MFLEHDTNLNILISRKENRIIYIIIHKNATNYAAKKYKVSHVQNKILITYKTTII